MLYIVLSESMAIVTGTGGIIMITHDAGETWQERTLPRVDWIRKYCVLSESECWLIGNYFDITAYNDLDNLNKNKIFRTIDGGVTWVDLNISTELSSRDLDEIEFVNINTGYLISSGELYKSSNGGVDWDLIDYGMTEKYRMIKFLDENTAFLITQTTFSRTHAYGHLNKTSDSGQTWTTFSGSDYGSIYFVNEQTVWSGNYKSTDAGDTWQYIDFNYPASLTLFEKHRFINDLVGCAMHAAILYRTNDRGNNWDIILTSITDFGVVDSTTLYASSSGGLIQKTLDAGENWTRYGNGTTSCLKDIKFINDMIGYVIGEDGTILYSSNGGTNWIQQNIPQQCININFTGIDFINDRKGWVVGSNYILCTTNMGTDWSIQLEANLEGGKFWDIKFLDNNVGFAVGSFGEWFSGALYYTEDGGKNWNREDEGNLPVLSEIFFLDNEFGWIGGAGILLSTTDGGLNWYGQNFPEYLGYIQFTDRDHGWMTAQSEGAFYRTTNGGLDWENVDYENRYLQRINCFHFINNDIGIASTFSKTNILTTGDGGNNWKFNENLPPVRLEAIQFINDTLGWAVGHGGAIIKFDGSYFNVTSVENFTENQTQKEIDQISIYPNPFNNITNIKFTLTHQAPVTLSVYSVHGELVENIRIDTPLIGENTIKWHPEKLSSGIYLIRIISKNINSISKCIYLK